MNTYKYIGSKNLLELAKTARKGKRITSQTDVIQWIQETNQELNYDNQVIVTYIIDLEGHLLIADRHSEHVTCAGGENVLSAGEMIFELEGMEVKVVDVTNQSTGYCPEPESWPVVQTALKNARLVGPNGFSQKFIFRICHKCGLLNIVKENWFICIRCNQELNKSWNIRDSFNAGKKII